jgi:hypothetical protein
MPRKPRIELPGRLYHVIPRGKLAAALGLDPSAVTRRMEAARSRGKENAEVAKLEKALGERPG